MVDGFSRVGVRSCCFLWMGV